MNNPYITLAKIVVTCPKRLTPYLKKELLDLNYELESETATGVEIIGTLQDTYRINLNIRTGNQVLYLINQFEASNADELYAAIKEMEWENLIEQNGYFSISSHVENDTIKTNLFANLRVKDAIADRFMDQFDERPDSGSMRNKSAFHIFWKGNSVNVYIDSSGETLAKHGYRKMPHLAPMLENLAAACLLSTKWDKKTTIVNPMCGSGTIAIEAALIALQKTPGFFRNNYGFMHLKGYDEEIYLAERKLMKDRALKDLPFRIIATDIDPNAIVAAKANADTAGVAHFIDFDVCDFTETQVPAGPGIVFLNPEYGERMGEYDELEIVYKQIGDFLKQKCKGYLGYIFTASPNLAKKIGLKAERKVEFYNSVLDCRLMEYDIYDGSKREPKVNQEKMN